jgi:hypothetical protein
MARYVITLWDDTELNFTNWEARVEHGMFIIEDAHASYVIPLSSIRLMQEIAADNE